MKCFAGMCLVLLLFPSFALAIALSGPSGMTCFRPISSLFLMSIHKPKSIVSTRRVTARQLCGFSELGFGWMMFLADDGRAWR